MIPRLLSGGRRLVVDGLLGTGVGRLPVLAKDRQENRAADQRRDKRSVQDAVRGHRQAEPLRHALAGYWSRRINDEHRFVYKPADDALLIAQLRYHD